MKFAIAAVLAAAVSVDVTGTVLRQKQTPDEVKLGMEYREKDSFGNTALAPACSKVECGEYSCPAPFELKTDGTCCGYCWAPDHVVAADRHRVVEYNATGFVVEQCDDAPSTCKGPGANVVRCFKPSCREGETASCGGGRCCPLCQAR